MNSATTQASLWLFTSAMPGIERALLLDPQLAIAEGYMDGEIEIRGRQHDLRFSEPCYAQYRQCATLPGWMGLADGFPPGNAPPPANEQSSGRRGATPAIITIFRARSTTYSSTRTSNIPAPISRPEPRRWKRRSLRKSGISPGSFAFRPASACSISAAAGAGCRCIWRARRARRSWALP